MSNFKIKFKEIFLPIAVVSILVISFYNLIRWYFDIKFGPIPLNREILDVGIPIVLPWVFILIFLRKKIRILNIAGRRDNGHMLFQILVSSLMFVPIMISRNYLTKSVYSLIEVENSIDIKDFRKEKYFSIKNFELNEKKILIETSSKTSKSDLILYMNFLYSINEAHSL